MRFSCISHNKIVTLPIELRTQFYKLILIAFDFKEIVCLISKRYLTIGDTRLHLGILKASFCLLSVSTSIAPVIY